MLREAYHITGWLRGSHRWAWHWTAFYCFCLWLWTAIVNVEGKSWNPMSHWLQFEIAAVAFLKHSFLNIKADLLKKDQLKGQRPPNTSLIAFVSFCVGTQGISVVWGSIIQLAIMFYDYVLLLACCFFLIFR